MIECHSNPKVVLVSWAPSLALHHLEVKLGVGSVLRQMCEQAVGRQDQMGSQHPNVSSLNALMDGERSQNELDMAEWWVGKESVTVQALTLERLKHYPSSSWDALLLHGYTATLFNQILPFSWVLHLWRVRERTRIFKFKFSWVEFLEIWARIKIYHPRATFHLPPFLVMFGNVSSTLLVELGCSNPRLLAPLLSQQAPGVDAEHM